MMRNKRRLNRRIDNKINKNWFWWKKWINDEDWVEEGKVIGIRDVFFNNSDWL